MKIYEIVESKEKSLNKQLNEKFKSQQQAKLMYAAAGDPKVAKKTGVSQKVAKEFIKKSKDQKVSKLPKKVTENDETEQQQQYVKADIQDIVRGAKLYHQLLGNIVVKFVKGNNAVVVLEPEVKGKGPWTVLTTSLLKPVPEVA
jgi:hypothetical protein